MRGERRHGVRLAPHGARAREDHRRQGPQALSTDRTPDRRVVDPPVLIGVLKDRRDLDRLRIERWYRIPRRHAPTRPFAWLAFYQPASFKGEGRCIRYYAAVRGRRLVTRRELFPDEPDHPRAGEKYWKVTVGPLLRLPQPLRNALPRRLTFVYTSLRRLFAARELFGVFTAAPLEQLVDAGLRRARLPALREFTVTVAAATRYRLDFAVFCAQGAVAVECDAVSSHGSAASRRHDQLKDVALRRQGWTVIRLRERAILGNLPGCLRRVRAAVRRLGGPVPR